MQKNIRFSILFLFCLISVPAWTQQFFSVEAVGSLGGSFTYTNAKGNYRQQGIGAKQLELSLTYHYRRFFFGTGLAYLRSGYQNEYNTSIYPSTLPEPIGYEQAVFQHFILPVNAGLELPMGRHFAFMPFIGADLSYNHSARFSSESTGLSFYEQKFSSAEFNERFRRWSAWAHAGARLSCKVNEQLGIVGGVQAAAMLTGLRKTVSPGDDNLRLATLTFALGLQYRFSGE